MEYYAIYPDNDYRCYLQHHGILGMKWGVRRYQNEDGSLTDRGKKRYAKLSNRIKKAEQRKSKLESEKETPRYLKKQAKIQAVENKLERRKFKNQRIRDKKLFSDKDPGFFARRSLRKEAKLSKKIYKLNKTNRVLDMNIYKESARINKYKRMLDAMTA